MPPLRRHASQAGLLIVALGASANVRDGRPAPHARRAATAAPVSPTPVPAAATERDTLPAGRLLVPVAGVRPGALRDAFTEPRSGRRVHEAIDIMAPRGTPVVSATEGKLLKLHRSKLGGLMVYAADASDRFILMYAHLDRYAAGLVPGATIRRGQLLGYVGTTGNAPKNAPHLHFAIARGKPSERWWAGTPVNPYPVLARGLTLARAQVAAVSSAPPTRSATRAGAAKRAVAKRAVAKRAVAKRAVAKPVTAKRAAS